MSRLFEARDCVLTKPLKLDEIGYLYSSKILPEIVRDIKEKKYGSYLVGGIVGTGKTSQVEIATKLAIKDSLTIHVKFYNEHECVNEFEKFLMTGLINAIKENGIDKKSETLTTLVNECEESMKYVIGEVELTDNVQENENKQSSSIKLSFYEKLGISFNKLICGEASVAGGGEEEDNQSVTDTKKKINTVTKTRIQRTHIEYVYTLLDELSEKEVVFIFDELDKLNEDVLGILFSKYKELFVEKDIFNFFIVNDKIYKKYSDSNITQNPTFTYFMRFFYVPLLDFRETLRYSKMMFAEDSYINGLVTYYLCIGNYRMINQRYLSSSRPTNIDIVKAYIHKKVIDKMSLFYYDNYMKDVLVRRVKNSLERIIMVRFFNTVSFAKRLEEEYKEIEMWPDYCTIVNCIVEVIKEICPDAIEEENEMISVKSEEMINNSSSIEEMAKEDRGDLEEIEKQRIQLSDMYRYKKSNQQERNRSISFLYKAILPLKVADNIPSSYGEILVNLLYTNLDEPGVQVIVIRKERGSKSYYPNDYEYTGMVVVDKGYLQVAYYVEKGSYDSEDKDAVEWLIKEAKHLNVNIEYLTANEKVDVAKDILSIVDAFNNPDSKNTKVVCEKWGGNGEAE